MRVITGTARGRKLKAPRGMETRPTADRIKEALFNIIGSRIVDINFLDLYAGTGAIGIEAISRGALRAVFVEKNPSAVKIIKENLEITGLTDRATILNLDVERAVEMLRADGLEFEITFIDPPYRKDLVRVSLEKLDRYKLAVPGGLVITESSKSDVLPDEVGALQRFRDQRYGDTVLTFYQRTNQ